MIRLFAALGVPDAVAAMLAGIQVGVPGADWRPPESLHLTLRFAGDIPETVAAEFEAELAAIGGAPFALRLGGVGAFDGPRKVRALWAGVQESQPLRRLARKCETAARRAGLAPEKRPWRAHVTLAYAARADPVRAAAWIQAHNLLRSPPFEVTSFGLYSSRRRAAGPAYQLERLYPLA